MRRINTMLVANLVGISMLFGCSQGQTTETKEPAKVAEQAAPQISTEPIILNLYAGQTMSTEFWNLLLHEPLKKLYPNITVNIVPKGKGIEELVASGLPFDLFLEFHGNLGTLTQVGLLEDMTPLAKRHNEDLSRFTPLLLDTLKEYSDKSELFALPFSQQVSALYYNKDIFDKFGVPYPKDGMTWEEATELGRKLTRQDGGTQYYGLDPEHAIRMAYPLSLVVVNGRTNKAEVNNEKWQRVFQNAKTIYSIPGNMPAKASDLTGGAANRFIKNKNVAMFGTVNIVDRLKEMSDNGINWDIAQYPSYSGQPNVAGMVDMHVAGVTKTSKYKDAAFRVVQLLTSNEIQTLAAKQRPTVSTLANPELEKQFAADLSYMKGKNIAALFKSKAPSAPRFSVYFGQGRAILDKHYVEFIQGKTDMNTALRAAEEEINKQVTALTAK
jgi:multiple sugar transport system substrate-binding protein